MVKKRLVGLHLRLTDTLQNLLDEAIALKMPIVQCFFIYQANGLYLSFQEKELEATVKKIKKNFKNLYLHGSYWINLAGKHHNGWRVFKKELELAQALGFTHMVIHPGSAKGCETKQEGIELLAKALNRILAKNPSITLVLENTSHAKMSVGSDLQDFKVLLPLLHNPEKILFCLDSGHAFSYGYDLATQEGLDAFVQEVDETIGCDRVVLLHLNDIQDPCGSKIDRHACPGEGTLGTEALQRFMSHPRLKHADVIVEPPALTFEQEKELLHTVNSWL